MTDFLAQAIALLDRRANQCRLRHPEQAQVAERAIQILRNSAKIGGTPLQIARIALKEAKSPNAEFVSRHAGTLGSDTIRSGISSDASRAIALLQKQLSNANAYDWYRAQVAEKALDYLVAHPERQGIPWYLARNAKSDASKIWKRRREIIPFQTDKELGSNVGDRLEMVADPQQEGLSRAYEIVDWFERASLAPADRKVLAPLLSGAETRELAKILQLPLNRTRVIVSRARARAWALWLEDTLATA